jgi:serine/threonine-protein kinase
MPAPLAREALSDFIELGGGRRVRLIQPIGKGSASTVWRGVLELASGIRRLVALKLFDPVGSDETELVCAALAAASRRAACVRHPNVVEVTEIGVHHTQPFQVLELVEGVSLQAFMDRHAAKRARVPLDLALFISSEVLEALSGARTATDHEGMRVGLLHLGLTPREVLLSWRGEVKVGDFGLHTARGATSSVRSLPGLAARASAMPPEVARGLPGDARSDVFAVGLLMRELLLGPRFPRTATTSERIQLAREGYVQPLSFQPHLPEHLVAIIQRALEIDPAARHPSASAMAYELRRVVLAMGASDGRWFLRRALDREWGSDAEATVERAPVSFTPMSFAHADTAMMPVMELPVPPSSVARLRDPRDDGERGDA